MNETVQKSGASDKTEGKLPQVPRSLTPGQGEVTPNEVYRFLGAYWIYQDQIGWSRTQTIVIVEAAILAGALGRHGPLSPLILVLGSLLIHWLFRIIARDWQMRDYLAEFLDPINESHGLQLIPPPAPGGIRGRTVVARVSRGIIALNFILAAVRTWSVAGLPGSATVESWLR
jgi:hypothetical protein